MEKHYGLIVIGAGMTGLSTALAWTKTHDCLSDPVLILEKEPKCGGSVTTFARKGYRFDTVQIIPDISDVLDFFDLDEKPPLVPYRGTYARLFLADGEKGNCRIYPVATSAERFEKALFSLFPEERERIGHFFRYGEKLLDELTSLKTEPNPLEGLKILVTCRHIIRQSGRTYRKYLESFRFRDRELLEILDIFSSFSGLSGNRCAALLTACAMMTTLQGSWRPSGGFIQFPHAMEKQLRNKGVKIMTSARAEAIIVSNGKVRGVRCGGKLLESEYVVSTADAFKTAAMLTPAPAQQKKGWFKKLNRAVPSPSSFTIHLGLDSDIDLKALGFDCGYNVLTTGRATHEKCFDYWEKGEMLVDDKQFHLAVISPSAVTGGKPNLIIHVTPAAMGDWKKLRERDYEAYKSRKNEIARFYIEKVEQYMIPRLTDHIRFIDISTPATYERYLGTTDGSNSQMLSIPSNFGMYRLPTRTPVKGLFIPQFSHGIWPCLQAGLQVVDMITGGAVMGGFSRYKSHRTHV